MMRLLSGAVMNFGQIKAEHHCEEGQDREEGGAADVREPARALMRKAFWSELQPVQRRFRVLFKLNIKTSTIMEKEVPRRFI